MIKLINCISIYYIRILNLQAKHVAKYESLRSACHLPLGVVDGQSFCHTTGTVIKTSLYLHPVALFDGLSSVTFKPCSRVSNPTTHKISSTHVTSLLWTANSPGVANITEKKSTYAHRLMVFAGSSQKLSLWKIVPTEFLKSILEVTARAGVGVQIFVFEAKIIENHRINSLPPADSLSSGFYPIR